MLSSSTISSSARLLQDVLNRQLEDSGASTQAEKSSLGATILTNFFLFFLIFGLSATVHVRSLRHQLRNKFALLTGIAMQFLIMPLLGFTAVMVLQYGDTGFTKAMGIALLVVTSSPGGSYSNWWCSLFNADLALSVAMTAVSTILSIGMLPANLFLYTHLAYGSESGNVVAALDFGTLFISLGIVMGAIISGLFVSYKIDSIEFRKWANRGASISGVALIVVSALLSSVGTKTNFWSMHWKFYVGVAIPCVIGISLANVISRSFRLSKPECVAISVECCYQNTGIAVTIAATAFSDPEERAQAVAVPLFYGAVEALVIGVYCLWAWKSGWTKAPANEKFCVALTNTYEIEDTNNTTGIFNEDSQRSQRSQNIDINEGSNVDHDLPGTIEEEPSVRVPWWRPVLNWRKHREMRRYRKDSDFTSDNIPATTSGDGDEELGTPQKKSNRNRLVSEDNTVATGTLSAMSAPPTPVPGEGPDIETDDSDLEAQHTDDEGPSHFVVYEEEVEVQDKTNKSLFP